MDMNEFAEKYSLTLWSTTRIANTTIYHFMDKLGINVLINPDSKEFELKWGLPYSIFTMESPSCSPYTNEEHFMRIYSKFRYYVLKVSGRWE